MRVPVITQCLSQSPPTTLEIRHLKASLTAEDVEACRIKRFWSDVMGPELRKSKISGVFCTFLHHLSLIVDNIHVLQTFAERAVIFCFRVMSAIHLGGGLQVPQRNMLI